MSYQDILPMVLTEIVGDIGYKKFAEEGGIKHFVAGTLGYIGVIYFLIRSLQGTEVIIVNAIWDGLSTLIETIAAMIILGERLHDPYSITGIIFVIVGIILMRIPVFRKNNFEIPSLFR